MGIAIPQVVTEDRASGAQVIDGSLKIDKSKNQYLKRTASVGNRKTWTISFWAKRTILDTQYHTFMSVGTADGDEDTISFDSNRLRYRFDSGSDLTTTQYLRDTGWYHIVVSADSTLAASSDRLKFYINGERVTSFSSSNQPGLNFDFRVNSNQEHAIGKFLRYSAGDYDGHMSQYYLLDGAALGPESFGFTDPLTNTWRPKKFEGIYNVTPTITYPAVYTSSAGTYGTVAGVTNSSGVFSSAGSTPAGSIKVEFSPGISNVTHMRFNGGGYSVNAVFSIKVNGSVTHSNLTTNSSYAVRTETISSTNITSFEIVSASDGWALGNLEFSTDGSNFTSPSGTPVVFSPAVNGFYLPMDGNSPIGEDQSGNGNNWTPVNFGGSAALDKATGALPILNTDGGGRTARPGTRTDPYASSIVMAIPFLGNTNDISAVIKGSGSNLAVTTSGSPAADSDPVQWYGSSFNVSTNNHIDTIGTTSTFAFLHQPEVAGTIEGWINTNAVNVQGPWFQTSNGTNEIGVRFRQNSSTNLSVQIDRGTSGTNIVIDSSITIALNTWYHWAFVKSADGYAQFFLNGVATGNKVAISTAAGASNAASTSATSTHQGRIAKNNGEARGIGANICDYRAYTVQKYAFDTSFIPASTNPDILPDTPSGVSGSSKLAKITEGAVSFDGTGDHLNVGSSSDFTMGTGDFTVECFITKDDSSHKGIWQISSTSGGLQSSNHTQTLALGYQSNRWQLYAGGSQVDGSSPPTTGSVAPKKWYHLAVVRNSGTTKLYVDGREEISTSDTYDYAGTYMVIGGYYNTSYLHQGFISNLRVLKGTALYTSNFTPPTRELTNVTNTKLLCCQSNTLAGIAAVSPNLGGINDGTVWSSGCTISSGGANGGNILSNAFDGSTSNAFEGDTSGATVTVPVSATISAGGVRVYAAVTSGNPLVVLIKNGGTTVETINGAINGGQYYASSSYAGPITSLIISRTGRAPEFNAIEIGGTVLTDPVKRVGNAAATNFNPFTTDINAVRGQESGYATLNPLAAGSRVTLSNGNLDLASTAASGQAATMETYATFTATSGKFYAEVTNSSNRTITLGTGTYTGSKVEISSGGASNTLGGSASGSGASFGTSDLMAVAVDFTNKNVYFYKNNILIYSVTGYTVTKDLFFGDRVNGSGSAGTSRWNFGQKPFKFPPPDGFQPLNAANVRPETMIARPDHYFAATIYTGNGAALSDTAINTSTAYRYHRILFEGDNGGGSLSEIEFYDADGVKIDASDTNNAGGTVATNGTSELDGWTAFNGTRGGSGYAQGVRKDGGVGSAGFYISKDWGSGQTKTIYGVKVWGVDSYGLAGNTANRYMKLQGSNNNSDWTDLQTWNNARYGAWTTSSSTTVGHVSDQSHSINTGQKPDFVWIKNRDQNEKHILHDTVRGIGNTLYSNNTDQADTGATYSARFKSFDFNGFTVGTNHSGTNSTDDFIAWCWKAGGNKGVFNVDDVGYANASDVNMNVGGQNDNAYNRDQTWSNYLIPSTGSSSSAFDGSTTTEYSAGANDASFYLNVDTVINSLEIYGLWTSSSTVTVTVGSASESVSTSGSKWYTFSGLNGSTITSVNKLLISRNIGLNFATIRLNGKILVNQGVSVANVPSIAPTGASVGTKQGFSIIKYTGNGNAATIPHGLSQTPTFIIKKFVSASSSWDVWTPNLDANNRLTFNPNEATSSTTSWQNVNASTFDVHAGNNDNTVTMITYLWHDVPGLQKFGSYSGGGTTNVFINTGMAPKFIMIKCTNTAKNWLMFDTTRYPNNPQEYVLRADSSGGRDGSYAIDILSNGFILRSDNSHMNGSGNTYVYAAWAEAPAFNLYGAQSNAR